MKGGASMANIAALNTVYNHYLTTYAPKSTSSQYDTHKKSELRSLYNSIVKMNKESPLYLFSSDASTGKFAVGMKENARELTNVISSLSNSAASGLLNKKAVASSDDSIVSATFIGEAVDEENLPSLQIEVKSLAQEQINNGNQLPQGSIDLEPSTYSFDIHIKDLDYEHI